MGDGEIKRFDCEENLLGRYVTVHFMPDQYTLTLCEVEVYSADGKAPIHLQKLTFPENATN